MRQHSPSIVKQTKQHQCGENRRSRKAALALQPVISERNVRRFNNSSREKLCDTHSLNSLQVIQILRKEAVQGTYILSNIYFN